VTRTAALSVNPVSPTTSASFLRMDWVTQGNWKSTYNDNGVVIIGDGTSNASYATVTPSHQNYNVWSSSTTDIRALQKLSTSTGRIAADWYSSNSFYVDIKFSDQLIHQVAIYCLDWNN